MKIKDEILQELKDLQASKLAHWQSQSDRQIMSGSDWDKRIDQAIFAGRQSPVIKRSRRFSLSYVGAIAAGFLVLLAGAWVFFQYDSTKSLHWS